MHRAGGSDADRRPSRRVQLAAVMLRRGDAIGDVARITGVPTALLDVMAAEPECTQDRVRPKTVERPVPPRGSERRGGSRLPRREPLIAAALIELVAVASTVLSTTSAMQRALGLTVLAGIAAANARDIRPRGKQG